MMRISDWHCGLLRVASVSSEHIEVQKKVVLPVVEQCEVDLPEIALPRFADSNVE